MIVSTVSQRRYRFDSVLPDWLHRYDVKAKKKETIIKECFIKGSKKKTGKGQMHGEQSKEKGNGIQREVACLIGDS